MHPRFDRQVFITRNDCVAAMAHNLVSQSPYDYPDNLSGCLDDFIVVLDKALAWQELDEMQFVEKFSLRESTEFFETLIMQCPAIVALNKRKNGNDSPYQFTSRYDAARDPDDSFIDLTALAQNMTCYFADKADAEAFLKEPVATQA